MVEDAPNLGAERTRRDRDGHRRRGPPDRIGRARKDDGDVAFDLLEARGFPCDEAADVLSRPRPSSLETDGGEDAAVVESKIPVVVGALREVDPLSCKHVTERPEVQRLAVGNDAVEVEDDGAEGHYVFGRFMRSPARMGILRRFSGGGYGHS